MNVFCKLRGSLWLAFVAALCLGFNAQVARPSESADFPGKDAPVLRERPAFHGVSLGHSAAASEPIDIERDGVWEFAIKTNDTPPRYGVYSHAKRAWIDGPRELPRAPGAWSANDYDEDGLVEYAYQWGDSIRLYDPATDHDSTLWLLPDRSNPSVLFWGRDGDGRYLLAERSFNSMSNGFVVTYDLVICDLMTGERGKTLYSVFVAPFEASELIPDFPQPGQIGHALVYESVQCVTTPHTGQCLTIVQPYAVGPDWQMEAASEFVYAHTTIPLPPDGYQNVSLTTIAGDNAALLRFIAAGKALTSYYVSSQLCSLDGSQDNSCLALSPDWDLANGMWVYDIDRDGKPELIIPRKDNGGWELRDPYDLSERGVMANMPSVRVSTGPVETAGRYDMFYFQGDSLYVWGPAAKSGGERGTTNIKLRQLGSSPDPDMLASVASLPRTFTLHAYPNPFNSSVRLTWPAQDQSVRLEILNVLGQRVRRFDLAEGLSTLEWNARNDVGQQVPSGVYFARLVGQKATAMVKIVLLK